MHECRQWLVTALVALVRFKIKIPSEESFLKLKKYHRLAVLAPSWLWKYRSVNICTGGPVVGRPVLACVLSPTVSRTRNLPKYDSRFRETQLGFCI